MIENWYILFPLLFIALAFIVVGLVYLALGTIEWMTGNSVSVAPSQPLGNGMSVDREVKRLEELATLERNHRIASENK